MVHSSDPCASSHFYKTLICYRLPWDFFGGETGTKEGEQLWKWLNISHIDNIKNAF